MTGKARANLPRRKVLACHNYYREPGGESQVFELEVASLERAGHRVIKYTRRNGECAGSSPLGRFRLAVEGYGSGRTVRELEALVRFESPDVAIVQNVFHLLTPSLYLALWKLGVPIVQLVYNYRFVCTNAELFVNGKICERCVRGSHWNAVVRRCYRGSLAESAWLSSVLWIHRRRRTFASLISSFVVPDQFLGKKLVEGGIPESKIRVNPNPVALGSHSETTSHQGYVAFVGRLTSAKGVLTLIQAAALLKSTCEVRIAGQGVLEEEVLRRIKVLNLQDRVSFLGSVWGEDFRDLVANALAIVVPSEWYDNLPQIICQAWAVGRPVIASRINGIPEYVLEGQNGLLFEPGNARDLAAAIDRLVAMAPEEWASLSRSSRLLAEATFDEGLHSRRLDEIMEEVLSSQSSRLAQSADRGTI